MGRRQRKRRSRAGRSPAVELAARTRPGTDPADEKPVRTPGLTPREPPSYDPPGRAAERDEEAAAMTSFGEMLRRERELRGITLREVSEATKISIRYLEALERNDFTYLPGGAFTRGFIRAYAKYIGADEDEFVSAYLLELSQQEDEAGRGVTDPVEGLRHHHQAAFDAEAANRRRRWIRLVLVVVVLLALAGATAWWLLARDAGAGEGEPRPAHSETMLP